MPAKRVILMYISDVSGHKSAAMAIERSIKELSPTTETMGINAFRFTNPVSEKVINRIYMSVINRTPVIWDYLYDNPKVVKRIEKIKNTVHKFNTPKFKALFDEFKPDAVVCTQAFPCGMVADYKAAYGSTLPLVAVLTDYIPHSYWVYDKVDYYVTPSEEVSLRLAQKGVPQDKIFSLGIPFDSKFNDQVDRKAALDKLGLRDGLPNILIMGGGQGLGPIKTVVRSLEDVQGPFQEIIVAGANKKLYDSMENKVKKYKKKIVLLGYADNIHELMGIADIIITKPGGITTAEALAKKLPMVIIRPLPGQEISNTNYLIEKGAALKLDSAADTGMVAEDFLAHPDKLKAFSAAAGRISKPNASVDIARLVLKSING